MFCLKSAFFKNYINTKMKVNHMLHQFIFCFYDQLTIQYIHFVSGLLLMHNSYFCVLCFDIIWCNVKRKTFYKVYLIIKIKM